MSVGTTEALEPVPAPMPLFKRIVGTFFSPRGVFESLRAHPKWLDVLLIGIILGMALYVPMAPIIAKTSMDKAREQIEKVQQLSQEQKEQAIERQQSMFKVIGPISVVVVPVIGLLFFALLLWAGYGFLLGGRIRFVQAFSAVCHLNLIFIVAGILKLPLILARKSLEVATSLALVLSDADPTSVLYKFLDTFDIFLLWALVIMVIGMAVLARVSTAKSRVFGVILFFLVMGFQILGALMAHMGGR